MPPFHTLSGHRCDYIDVTERNGGTYRIEIPHGYTASVAIDRIKSIFPDWAVICHNDGNLKTTVERSPL